MTRDREQEAEDRGYVRYHCRIHGPFWSDTGAYCEQCGDQEDDEPEVDDDGVTDYDDEEEDTDGSE